VTETKFVCGEMLLLLMTRIEFTQQTTSFLGLLISALSNNVHSLYVRGR